MITEKLKFKGSLDITLFNPDGSIKEEQHVPNLVVDPGLAWIIARMKGDLNTTGANPVGGVAVMTHMGIGTSVTATADAQTALIAAHADGRKVLDSTTIATTTVANDTLTYVATFQAGFSTGAITEAGIFNAATVGTMLCRTVFSVVNKGALDSMVITWKVTAA
jgi:hypothetical protein